MRHIHIHMKEESAHTMTIQQGLDSLLQEVETVLETGDLAPQRLPYFEGARDYLRTLKRMASHTGKAERRAQRPKPLPTRAGQESG